MSKAIYQVLNMRTMMATTGGNLSSLLPSPTHHRLTSPAVIAAPLLLSLPRPSSSSSPASKTKISRRRTTEEEERKRRDRIRVHQLAEDMGLPWDPELEPDFMGPLWESSAANEEQKNSSADEPSSTAKEETSPTSQPIE